jgi:hypothetical protein
MSHEEQGCVGPVCLDKCNGLPMELPGVDSFTYRYSCPPLTYVLTLALALTRILTPPKPKPKPKPKPEPEP